MGKKGKEYVGQTKDFMTRIVQHFSGKSKKLPDITTLKTTVMKSVDKSLRETVEQITIRSKGGVDKLLNARNPFGQSKARQELFKNLKKLLKKKPPPPPPPKKKKI